MRFPKEDVPSVWYYIILGWIAVIMVISWSPAVYGTDQKTPDPRPIYEVVKDPQPLTPVEISEYEFRLRYPVTTEEVLRKVLTEQKREKESNEE
jgi:hypothetical protein